MPSKLLIAAGRQPILSVRPVSSVSRPPHASTARRDASPAPRARSFAQTTRDEIAALPQGTTLRGKARFTGPNNLMLEDGTSIIAKPSSSRRALAPPCLPILCRWAIWH
jgi:dihydrolipoamide dehydrogenase